MAQDQNACLAQYEKLADSCKRMDKKLKSINEEIRMKVINGRRIREFIIECEQMPSEVTEFNDGQWATFVDRVTICGKDDIRFTLTSGTEVRS